MLAMIKQNIASVQFPNPKRFGTLLSPQETLLYSKFTTTLFHYIRRAMASEFHPTLIPRLTVKQIIYERQLSHVPIHTLKTQSDYLLQLPAASLIHHQ